MHRKRGFTLIELLVVIAIIALLLSIIIPSLRLAKEKAASIICMTNVKNLSLGWFSYKEDNDGEIMSSCMGGTTDTGNSTGRRIPGWIERPKSATGTTLSPTSSNVVTDEDEIRGIEAGALDPYLKSPKVFNCPADKVKALSTYDTVDPEKFVTYAMADSLAGVQAVAINQPTWRILKYHQIKTPSVAYNFVETAEERNYIQYGHFVFGAKELGHNPQVWWGPMAVNHGNSSILGFTDGHAETRNWQDSYTKERVDKLSRLGTDAYNPDTGSDHNSSTSEDVAYMAKGWPYRHRK